MFKEEKKMITSWWIYFAILIVFTSLVFGLLNYVGIIGKTIVERKVFEQSYQKQAGDKSRMATYKAQLAQVNSKLVMSPNDQDLLAQKAMLQVQINSQGN